MAQCEKGEEFSVEELGVEGLGGDCRPKISLGMVTTSVQVKGGGRYYTMIALWVV